MIDHALLQDFVTEAGEHLEELESGLLQLESDPENGEVLNDIFRSVHSIKGAAQFVGLENISSLTHRLETLLDLARNKEVSLSQNVVDILMASKDRLAKLTDDLAEGQTEQTSVDDLVAAINLQIEPPDTPDPEASPPPPTEIPTTEPNEANLETSNPLGDEIYDEEQDAELYEIFVDQLKEKSASIRSLSAVSESPERKQEGLASVLDHLQALRSAANYMGYETLLGFYDDWIQDTSLALTAAEQGDDPSVDFMLERLHVLEDRFPELKPSSDDPKEPDTGSSVNTEDEDFDDVIDTIFSTDLTGPGPEVSDPEVDELYDEMEHEVYTEELDQELFDIFLNHLTDSISALWEEGQRWSEASNPSECLERSAGILDRLQSSANYMGYNQLRSIFAQWRDKVEASREMLAFGDTVSLDFWNDYMDRIVTKFPDAEFCFDPDVNVDEANQGVTLDVQPDSDATVDVASADPELFDMLSSAFDDTALGDTDYYDHSFQSVIDEMIAGQGVLPVDHFVPSESPPETGTHFPPLATAPTATESKPAMATGSGDLPKPMDSKDTGLEHPQKEPPSAVEKSDAQGGGSKPVGRKKFKQSVRVDADKIDYLMNQVGELVVSRAFFFQLFNDLRFLHEEMKEELNLSQKELKPLREFSFRLGEATVALGRVSNELQEGVMKVRMLPIAQLFSRYPRLVRDLVHNSSKNVTLKTRGEDTELDKMIIEAISDPLIHIIRNAVDHGFETTDERRRLGKPDAGALMLEAYHESNHIVIEVTDDGRGIDTQRIRARALEGGFMSKEDLDRMTDREILRLVMMPGFSTAGQATQTSGRGVGMDVVKKNIEKLNGTIEIESKIGVQTRIRIKIPLTLAIISALLVRVGEELFTIPLTAVEETIRIFGDEITTIEGIEVIHLREKTTPILRLSELFGLRPEHAEDGKNFIVIVNTGSQHVGLVVDALIGQEEVVIKPLPDYLRQKSGFSGATIIGDGHISLILDVYDLVNMTIVRQNYRRERNGLSLSGALAMKDPVGETSTPTIH